MIEHSPRTQETLDESSELFRAEALRFHRDQYRGGGTILEISPKWTRWAYWPLVGIVAAAALYAFFGTIDEFASGPAVVRAEGATEITATWAGTVEAVPARFGESVAAGNILVRFDLADEAAEADRLQTEHDLHLVRFLRNPADQSARQSLSSLRAQLELAHERLERRFVRAPHAGVVSDVRIRPGQHLTPGEPILSLMGADRSFSLVAILPGEFRPLLEEGAPLRLELAGYEYEYEDLAVRTIGDEIVGPNEVRRYLGSEIADTVFVAGPVILVEAGLPGPTFTSEGTSLNYYDGMAGRAEVRLRSQRILLALVPGLKSVLGDGGP